MLFKPKWVKMLPNHMRPEDNKIKQLEELRKQLGIPHEIFTVTIQNSRATTRKVQKHFLEEYRRLYPDASEKELWMMVLVSRMEALRNKLLTDTAIGSIKPEEAENKIDEFSKMADEIEEVIENIDSFEEFCDYIISVDERLLGEQYSSNIIDKILEE